LGINNHPENDRKRFTGEWKDHKKFVDISHHLHELGILHSSHELGKVVFIVCLPGCKPQVLHTDYKAGLWPYDLEHVPIGCLIALTSRTYVVYPKTHLIDYTPDHKPDCTPLTIHMQPGDVVITRGDVLHHGDGCEHGTIAIHAYIDIPSIRGGRHLQNAVHTFL